MANEMNWIVQSGFLTNEDLNKTFQRVAQPLFRYRQFAKFKEAFGLHKGQTQNWLKVSNMGNIGRQLVETNTMPETSQPLAWGTVTVQEYGQSIPFTFKVQSLSEFDIRNIVRESLMDGMVKLVDGIVEREFNSTVLRYVGTTTAAGAVTTNGTATATNTGGFTQTHLRKMVTQLKNRNVPGFTGVGGDYVMIASPLTLEQFSTQTESVSQNVETGYKKILNGETSRYHGVRIVEDTWATVNTVTPTTGGTAAPTTFTSLTTGAPAYVFGSPTVREIVAVPEEIRGKVVTDYGRSHGLGWYMIAGWQLEWGTAAADQANARIIKWDSA
jgi:N4-gp56 family major capsid protein